MRRARAVASDRDPDALYLRGLEERSHHSLVFRKTDDAPVCERVGLRVFTKDDLDRAFEHFSRAGLNPDLGRAAVQGRTLHVDDPVGTPLEFCATMDDLPTNLQKFELLQGREPDAARSFPDRDTRRAEGDRILHRRSASASPNTPRPTARRRSGAPGCSARAIRTTWCFRQRPRAAAASLRLSACRRSATWCTSATWRAASASVKHFERGPGRHGIGNAFFVYFRDPDGHRIELFNAHYQAIDINHTPLRWELSNTRRSQLWGLPAPARWFYEASEFAGKPMHDPTLKPTR